MSDVRCLGFRNSCGLKALCSRQPWRRPMVKRLRFSLRSTLLETGNLSVTIGKCVTCRCRQFYHHHQVTHTYTHHYITSPLSDSFATTSCLFCVTPRKWLKFQAPTLLQGYYVEPSTLKQFNIRKPRILEPSLTQDWQFTSTLHMVKINLSSHLGEIFFGQINSVFPDEYLVKLSV